jgi:hypothetical protein
MIRFQKVNRENDPPLSITGYSQSGLSVTKYDFFIDKLKYGVNTNIWILYLDPVLPPVIVSLSNHEAHESEQHLAFL